MSAAEALKAARAAGIKLTIDGDDLVLEASAPPPPAVIDRLTGHKTEIVAMLRPRRDGWSADDWQAFFDERAGITEFDGGLSRANVGLPGRTSVDLRRARLWLEWVLAAS
jgi:hypothetical protein